MAFYEINTKCLLLVCFAAWFIAVQTLMTFAVVFEFLALAVFPCCLMFPDSTKWLWLACFVTAMISQLHFAYRNRIVTVFYKFGGV